MTKVRAVIAGCLLAALLAALRWNATAQPEIEIRVLSSDPARVTGGDALLEVAGLVGGQPLTVAVNGQDVTSAFQPGTTPGHQIGVVSGLSNGENIVAARQGKAQATVKIINHPVTGPVFAGPKQAPFYCETQSFKLADGTYLPAAKDADCSVDTVVAYLYRPVGAKEFVPLSSLTQLPNDVATTTTLAGVTVPYVVRVETGTINRGIYQIAVLHDPTSEAEPSPTAPPKGWNQRMVYVFAGGCRGMYRQGSRTGPLIDDQFLSQGFLTVSNSLNVYAINCDDLLAAETVMMTRERAIEFVGVPLYTLGWGCSGGSHQLLSIAQNYPGLLDGIVPLCNSVDWTRLHQFYSDLALVYDWFKTPVGRSLTTEQKVAITGVPLNTAAPDLARSIASLCPDIVPVEKVYHPETNPGGLRCTNEEHQVNSIGRDPESGFARSLVDNVGVQYGLGALEAGIIDVATFLDLNEHIGGYDRDGLRSRERAVADPVGIETYYRAGRVITGGLGLRDVPIVELRNYSDRDEDAVHTKYSTNVLRARLQRENGMYANHVVLLEGHDPGWMSASNLGGDEMSRYALARMDRWLTALATDTGGGTHAEKLARTKPADLTDSCYDEKGHRIVEEQTVTGGRCNELYPTHLPPRMVAGGPLTNDVLKCRLKPVSPSDYKVSFTDSELARLKSIFPDGVCDWSQRGVGQVSPRGTWQTF
jgi:hypothetical protein